MIYFFFQSFKTVPDRTNAFFRMTDLTQYLINIARLVHKLIIPLLSFISYKSGSTQLALNVNRVVHEGTHCIWLRVLSRLPNGFVTEVIESTEVLSKPFNNLYWFKYPIWKLIQSTAKHMTLSDLGAGHLSTKSSSYFLKVERFNFL
jgi:hypothetical protein